MAMTALQPAVRPANTPHTAAVATAVNDNLKTWMDDPRAKMLLASCVTHPPAGEVYETRYVRSVDKFFRYAGYRAEALEAIRMEHGERLTLAYQLGGEDAYPPLQA